MKDEETSKIEINSPLKPQEFTRLIRLCRKKQEYSDAVSLVCRVLSDLGYHEGAMLFKATEEENIQFLMQRLIPSDGNNPSEK